MQPGESIIRRRTEAERIAYIQGYAAAMETIFGRLRDTIAELRVVMDAAMDLAGGLSDLDKSDSP